MKPYRAPWDAFPDVLILSDVRPVKDHPEYADAKTGDIDHAAAAAKRLSADFVSDQALVQVRRVVGIATHLVPVHALEGGGHNRIPGAFAELLADQLGLEVETAIVQANVVNHTGASGWERLARPPLFVGDVVPGRNYALVDDFVGQGGTLANLRGHIIHAGGAVTGAITLTGKGYSAKLALREQTLRDLAAKHGKELEKWWLEAFGYELAQSTESEARYLIRAEDVDTIRAQLTKAGLTSDD
jgi:hypothetical protein